MEHNSLVVDQSDFEDACDQLIVAIKILKRSVRPPEATAPAEAPPKKVKAKKAAATPEPTPKPTLAAELEANPVVPDFAAMSKEEHVADIMRRDAEEDVLKATLVEFATANGKAAAIAKLNSLGFERMRDIPPQGYAAVIAAFKE